MNKNSHPLALITGASRGIGRAMAEVFGAAGYHLVLTCRSSLGELERLADRLSTDFGISCQAYRTDMGNPKEVEWLFDCLDSLDILINNAGISHIGLLSDMSVAEWRQVMAVNLDSCFFTARHAIPLMLQKHSGKIINISSVWGSTGASMEVAYSASKGGMNAFTKALAKELAPSGIQVNAIACGVIDTDMNSCFSPKELEELIAEIPADRMGSPKEVALLALQLARSPAYLTGQIITLDGGWC